MNKKLIILLGLLPALVSFGIPSYAQKKGTAGAVAEQNQGKEGESPSPGASGTPKPKKILTGHTDAVNVVEFSRNEKFAITASNDKTIKFWDVKTGKEIPTRKDEDAPPEGEKNPFGHSEAILSMAVSPDGKTLATGGGDYRIKIWKIDGMKEIKTLNGHFGRITSLAYINKNELVSTGFDHKIRIWNVWNGGIKASIDTGCPNFSIAISPDGKMIASGGKDKQVKVWTTSGTLIKTFSGHVNDINYLSFDKSGKTIASSAWQELKLWDLSSGSLKNNFNIKENATVKFSSKGDLFITGGGLFNKSIKIWKYPEGKLLKEIETDGVASTFAISRDGSKIVSASDSCCVSFWNTKTGKNLFEE